MINSVGLQGPGVEAWLARRPARRSLAAGARGRGVDLGSHASRSTRRPPRSRRRARGGRRRRGEPLLPQHRGGPRPLRPLGRRRRATPWRPPRRAVARAGRSSARTSPTSCRSPRRPRARRRRGRHARQHRARHGHRPRDRRLPARLGRARRRAVGPGHPPDRRAGRPRRPRRAARPARSSASAASPAASDAAELILAGAVGGAGRHRHLRRPRAPARVLERARGRGLHRTARPDPSVATWAPSHGRETAWHDAVTEAPPEVRVARSPSPSTSTTPSPRLRLARELQPVVRRRQGRPRALQRVRARRGRRADRPRLPGVLRPQVPRHPHHGEQGRPRGGRARAPPT